MSPVFAYWLAPYEWLVIGIVALLLFGNRLPSLMRNLGKGITEFKKGVQGVDDEDDKGGTPRQLDKEAESKSPDK